MLSGRLDVNKCFDVETRPLCTSTKLNLIDRVLDEVEQNSFIALPGKGAHSGLMPSKLCIPTQGACEESYSQGVGLLIRIRVPAGPAFLQSRDHLASGGIEL